LAPAGGALGTAFPVRPRAPQRKKARRRTILLGALCALPRMHVARGDPLLYLCSGPVLAGRAGHFMPQSSELRSEVGRPGGGRGAGRGRAGRVRPVLEGPMVLG